MKKNVMLICVTAAVCCAVMAVVDGILQPGYAIKSGIKIAVFLVLPFILCAQQKLPVAECFHPDKKALLTGSCLGTVTFVIVMTAYALAQPYLDLSAVPQALEQSAGVTKDNFLFVGTYIALCNSLLEEFFFRSFVFLGLKKTTTKAFSYIFSAAAFALYHGGMLMSMVSPLLFALALIALFFCGLLFNFLNAKRERIWVSWLVHMGANLAINTVGMILLGML